jgi:OOP family OmpA-OmpF porin
VFSSKGYTGLGGFDLFESAGIIGYWGKPKNMSYPINSAKDDLYFYPDKGDQTKFSVSSDRESDCCLELFQVTDKRYMLAGLVVDCDTHLPLVGAKVTFVDSISKETLKEEVLDRGAKYAFQINTNRPYSLVIEKTGYFTKVVPVVRPSGKMVKDTLFSPDICLQAFEVNKPIVIKNILYDFNKADLREESKVVLNGLLKILKDNPKIKIELAAHTDSIGSDAYNNNLSQMRAQSCVDYITANGISTDRIFARGYGKTKPVAPNSMPDGKDNPDGRQLNRRTEFTVLKLE